MDTQGIKIIHWLQSGEGRLVAAALLFMILWAIKSIPYVKNKLLTTPARKQIAVAMLATAPAIVMLTEEAPIRDVFVAGLTMFLGAMGINTMRPSKYKAAQLLATECDGNEKEGSTTESEADPADAEDNQPDSGPGPNPDVPGSTDSEKKEDAAGVTESDES